MCSSYSWASYPCLTVVVFTGHDLSIIGDNILGNNSHNSLHTLDLSNNRFSRIQPGAFYSLKNLKQLILDDNEWNIDESVSHPSVFNHSNLTTLSFSNAFGAGRVRDIGKVMERLQVLFVNSSMPSLTSLRLSRNKIIALPGGFFFGMPNLQLLDLSNNKLDRINVRLSNLTHLQSLLLHQNAMNVIFQTLMDDIDILYDDGQGSLRNVTLSGNFILCNCLARNFSSWLRSGNKSLLVDADKVTCSPGPNDAMAGAALLDYKLSDLVCKEVTDTKQSSYVILIIVIGIITVIAVIVLILNRSFFINKYIACKEMLGSKHDFSIYGAKYSSVVS
ncbi:trophoblast glycoprotein-like [Watersipora subatra]|uniref:trophoblast glycoprotein-like n=1 Tax=Watersipora subatra TaxID=2589382 RepID=UPI00355BC696